jgi:hypothetical protein
VTDKADEAIIKKSTVKLICLSDLLGKDGHIRNEPGLVVSEEDQVSIFKNFFFIADARD